MSVGVGAAGGGSSSTHSHHPHPFSSFIHPTNPPPLHSPLQPYASPSLYPLPASHWPASFPQCLYDSYNALPPLSAAYTPAGPAASRSFPLPPPFSSTSSYGGVAVGAAGLSLSAGGQAAQSVFPPSSLPASAVVQSSSSSSADASFGASQQRTSIVQPRPINLSLNMAAPQQQHHASLSSFSSAASAASSSPPGPLAPSTSSSSSPRPVCRRKPTNLVLKLTVNLMELFNGINDHYYAAKERRKQEEREARRRERDQRESESASGSRQQHHYGESTGAAITAVPRAPSSPVNAFDDRDSNYIVRQQEQLCDGRYVVEQSLGKGSFGRVIQCRDMKAGRSVAVKIIKSKRAFYKQAQVEIRVLQSLQADCDRFNIVEMVDSFMHRNHQCIVFELLSINLYDLIRNTKAVGVTLILTAKFAYQILSTLAHLSSPARGNQRVIHCDLKVTTLMHKPIRLHCLHCSFSPEAVTDLSPSACAAVAVFCRSPRTFSCATSIVL